MAMIVAGRFTTFDEAEGGARHLYERAFGPDDVSIFFLNPGGQHARFPIGGDVYADTAAKPGGRGAMIGAFRGLLIGAVAGLVVYAIGVRYWFVPAAGALAGAYLGAFGGALGRMRGEPAEGKGTLTGSAEATVIECRGKTDTTCRAIQVLDKGFPERPVIGEDVLAGRDEIVNNPNVTPDDNGTCKDVTIEADPVEVTKTCRAGGWWNEKACRIGPVEIGKVTAKFFACAEGEGTSSERSCLTTVSGKPASSVWTERCFFGKESSAASGTVTEETSAVARAIFSGVCTSTDATTETVKCSEVLESNNDHGCVLGEKTTASVNGEYSLSHDPCSDGDVLIGQHTCGNSSYLAIQVKGFKSTRISLGYTLRNIAHRTNSSCKADYEWTKRECSGPTCTAKLGARVYYNGYMTGSMRLTLTYVNESYYIKEEWVDHCASIRPKTAATAEGS